MMKKPLIAAMILCVGVTACATNTNRLVIDRATSIDGGVNLAADRADCEDIAYDAFPEGSGAENAAGNALGGAAAGAAVGALVGAIFGYPGDYAAAGAIIGGASGAAEGAGEIDYRRRAIIRNCLRGRGYSVLNG